MLRLSSLHNLEALEKRAVSKQCHQCLMTQSSNKSRHLKLFPKHKSTNLLFDPSSKKTISYHKYCARVHLWPFVVVVFCGTWTRAIVFLARVCVLTLELFTGNKGEKVKQSAIRVEWAIHGIVSVKEKKPAIHVPRPVTDLREVDIIDYAILSPLVWWSNWESPNTITTNCCATDYGSDISRIFNPFEGPAVYSICGQWAVCTLQQTPLCQFVFH